MQWFEPLIQGYLVLQKKGSEELGEILHTLLPGFLAERKKWAERQRGSAEDFNLFEVLGVATDEVRHSRLLAWLLDHRIERGTHAQGSLGFRLFLEELCDELHWQSSDDVLGYALENYWVRCEVTGDQSRVDIEIASPAKFLIHIENKIMAGEGEDQTKREYEDLRRRASALGIAESKTHGIFLSPAGTRPSNVGFHAVRWSRIGDVFARFSESAQAPEVKLFALHCEKAIRIWNPAATSDAESNDVDL